MGDFSSQAVVMVLESTGDSATGMIIKLLQTFWKIGLITVDQMNRVSAFLCTHFNWNGNDSLLMPAISNIAGSMNAVLEMLSAKNKSNLKSLIGYWNSDLRAMMRAD